MKKFSVIILAAGKGTRMLSSLPKVLQCLAGRPMLDYVIETARSILPGKIVAVIGYKGDLVKERFKNAGIEFALQNEQLGTGHAVSQAESCIDSSYKDVLILSGDVPLIKRQTLLDLLNIHNHMRLTVSLFSSVPPDPFGYGRIVRDQTGKVAGIIEEKDADQKIRLINEINSGIYCVKRDFLFAALKNINCDNEQKEYYLTDVVKQAVTKGLPVEALKISDSQEVMGINTLQELLKMEKSL